MRSILLSVTLLYFFQRSIAEEVRLLDLEPTNAQQVIEKQDQSLHYAPKIESNQPAVRFLGNEPHHVLEDIYLARQYHGQDGLGGYLYGYNVPDIAKTEKKQAGGDLRGAYNYIAGDGQEIKVEYWDDGTGFHQIDNVPKILPKQIDDSPEVKAEKEKFLARWHEEAERNTHPVQNPYDSEGEYASGPLSPQGQQQQKQLVQYQQLSPTKQPGQYQQESYQQPGQYQQPTQYHQLSEQSGQYHQTGSYQKPIQYQQQSASSQYQQPAQQPPNSGKYEQPSQYQQQSQYQEPSPYQQLGQNQQTHNQQSTGQNQVDYSGQYSENQNTYFQANANSQHQTASQQHEQINEHQQTQYSNQKSNQIEYSGQHEKKYDEEEESTGPPKGFFYSFDYPVGIIVNKEGVVKREGNIQDVYSENKSKFEQQLQSGQSNGGSQSGYLYVKNQ